MCFLRRWLVNRNVVPVGKFSLSRSFRCRACGVWLANRNLVPVGKFVRSTILWGRAGLVWQLNRNDVPVGKFSLTHSLRCRAGLVWLGAVASGGVGGGRGVAVSFIQQGFQVGDTPVSLLQALDLAFRQDAVGGDNRAAFPFVLGGRLPAGIDAGQPVDQPLAVGAGHWASAQQPQAPQVAHRVADGPVGGVQPLGQGLLGRAALAGLKMNQQSVDRDGLGRVVGVAGDFPEYHPGGSGPGGARCRWPNG